MKHGDEWGDPAACENGDSCGYCHTRTEQQFHPEVSRIFKGVFTLSEKNISGFLFSVFHGGNCSINKFVFIWNISVVWIELFCLLSQRNSSITLFCLDL